MRLTAAVSVTHASSGNFHANKPIRDSTRKDDKSDCVAINVIKCVLDKLIQFMGKKCQNY